MIIDNEIKLDFCDVLIKPKRSLAPSRAYVKLTRGFKYQYGVSDKEHTPVIAANMSTTGTFEMARKMHEYGMLTALHKFYTYEQLYDFFGSDPAAESTFYTMGIRDEDFEKFKKFNQAFNLKYICIDAANGYTRYFEDRCKQVRELSPASVIMAGNVATPEMVQQLISAGVDIVKIGIGPGSVCTTRIVTGCGYPQLSAIIECADAAHGNKGQICADGGITESGSINKAFGAGADFVMLGGMLSGTDECEGEWEYEAEATIGGRDKQFIVSRQKKALRFYGMSSEEAMNKFYGGKAKYRAAEGKSVTVPYKGPVSEILDQIKGAIMGGCSLIGADSIKDMCKCTTFVRVNRTHNTIFGTT